MIFKRMENLEDIRFKAKRLDNGEWVEGYYYKECENTYIIEDRQKQSMLNRNEAILVESTTVCQYTGLKDMKAREIWEHDNITDFPHCGEVIFVNGEFAMHSDVGNLPLETFIDRVKEGALGTYGKCLVTNQGSKFDKKGGDYEEVS